MACAARGSCEPLRTAAVRGFLCDVVLGRIDRSDTARTEVTNNNQRAERRLATKRYRLRAVHPVSRWEAHTVFAAAGSRRRGERVPSGIESDARKPVTLVNTIDRVRYEMSWRCQSRSRHSRQVSQPESNDGAADDVTNRRQHFVLRVLRACAPPHSLLIPAPQTMHEIRLLLAWHELHPRRSLTNLL